MGAAGDFQAGRSVVHLLELVRMDLAFRRIDATPRFGDPVFAEPECMPAKAGGKQAAYRHSAKTGECGNKMRRRAVAHIVWDGCHTVESLARLPNGGT